MNIEMLSQHKPQQVAEWTQWLIQSHPQLVDAMRNSSHHFSPQHLSPWHLEGDVWSHTMMVLQAYARSDSTVDACVGLTALLHDIGKPGAAKVLHERQRVVFQGHESLSAWMAWELLQDETLALTPAQQCRIFSLIALHGCLYTCGFSDDSLVKEEQLLRAFSGFGRDFWQQLMAQIHHDTQGQITLKDNNKADLMRWSSLHMLPTHTDNTGKTPIVFFIGLPGAGKSTFRQRYAGYAVLSRDDVLHDVTQTPHYRQAWEIQEAQNLAPQIDHMLYQRFQDALNNGEPMVMDLTNLSRKSRQRWLSVLPAHYTAQALIFIASDKTLWQRNEQRGERAIPDKALQQMMLRFEHPLFDEFDDIRYVVAGSELPIRQC